MDEIGFEIKLPEFEGPFDLLLFFIERDEINIHDISISKITNDFLCYIQHMQSLNMAVASEFIYVAATLMRIKAKTLLPKPFIDEEGNEVDLKQDLIQKLIAYKQFKDVCIELGKFEDQRFLREKRGNIDRDLKSAAQVQAYTEELSSFDLFKLMQAYEKVMKNSLQKADAIMHTVHQYPYTIEKQKKAISVLLELNERLDFRSIAQHSENKIQFVYNFLAILEMLQQELLELELGLGYNNFWIKTKVS